MSLSGQKLRELQDALIDAFPSRASLEQMLWYGLMRNLNQIAGDRDLATVVFNLIKAANAEGWIKDLICEASQYNPGNVLLQAIATELLADNPTPTLYNSNKEDAIAEYRLKVEEFAEDGEISYGESEILKDLRKKLKLTEEEVRAVQDEVLELLRRHRENLYKYRQVFTKWVDEQGYPLKENAKADLKRTQEYYQLKDEDIALLEKEAEQLEAQRQQQIEQELDSRLQQPASSDDLSSDRGGDYTKLRNFLKAQQWFEADEETFAVMLKVADLTFHSMWKRRISSRGKVANQSPVGNTKHIFSVPLQR